MPPAHAPWRNAGPTLIDSLGGFAAVALADGRAFAMGVRISCDDEPITPIGQLWDPATGVWRETASLEHPRTRYAIEALADGRVLVAGGLSAAEQSYSSTYVFDPSPGHESWSKAGLLGTARTSPSSAVLQDGRVLLMGGYYQTGPLARSESPAEMALVAYRASGETTVRAADIGPEPWEWPLLATAELFDPVSGRWTPTGPLHHVQAGGPAVTLTDGRVLIVSMTPERPGGQPNTPELYDPRTGRFILTASLPEETQAEAVDLGSLVALPDGGALLVGFSGGGHGPLLSLSLRFDGRTGRWSEVGGVYEQDWRGNDPVPSSGVDRNGATAAVLGNGRVLVTGGITRYPDWRPTPRAELYYPPLGTFVPITSMPEARAWGLAMPLSDGSVLVLGSHGSEWSRECTDPQRFATAIRYVPGS